MRYLSKNLVYCVRGENYQFGNFSSSEFEDGYADYILIDLDLLSKLEDIRTIVCKPVTITSGFRSKAKQLQLKSQGYETAKGISTHEVGSGVDIVIEGYSGAELEEIAATVGIQSIGVGNFFIHIDMRSDKKRRWSYGG